jgi:2-(1,2-epoxy-1,2-dihydrophenyl)acetyl-CoA isomerase
MTFMLISIWRPEVDYETIKYEKGDSIATITLNRPDRLNAMSNRLLNELVASLGEADSDREVRAIIITGAGRGFCSGADLNPEEEATQDVARHPELFDLFGKMAVTLENARKPLLAAVNGAAVGAGLSLALGCDFRIASDQSRFSAIFVRRGLVPDGGASLLLPRIVGLSRAVEMLFLGDIIDAREAERIGLVSRVVPHQELMSVTRELAERLAKGPPLALELMKNITYRGLQHNNLALQVEAEAAANHITMASEDYAEGVRAFMEKREAQFKGS